MLLEWLLKPISLSLKSHKHHHLSNKMLISNSGSPATLKQHLGPKMSDLRSTHLMGIGRLHYSENTLVFQAAAGRSSLYYTIVELEHSLECERSPHPEAVRTHPFQGNYKLV